MNKGSKRVKSRSTSNSRKKPKTECISWINLQKRKKEGCGLTISSSNESRPCTYEELFGTSSESDMYSQASEAEDTTSEEDCIIIGVSRAAPSTSSAPSLELASDETIVESRVIMSGNSNVLPFQPGQQSASFAASNELGVHAPDEVLVPTDGLSDSVYLTETTNQEEFAWNGTAHSIEHLQSQLRAEQSPTALELGREQSPDVVLSPPVLSPRQAQARNVQRKYRSMTEHVLKKCNSYTSLKRKRCEGLPPVKRRKTTLEEAELSYAASTSGLQSSFSIPVTTVEIAGPTDIVLSTVVQNTNPGSIVTPPGAPPDNALPTVIQNANPGSIVTPPGAPPDNARPTVIQNANPGSIVTPPGAPPDNALPTVVQNANPGSMVTPPGAPPDNALPTVIQNGNPSSIVTLPGAPPDNVRPTVIQNTNPGIIVTLPGAPPDNVRPTVIQNTNPGSMVTPPGAPPDNALPTVVQNGNPGSMVTPPGVPPDNALPTVIPAPLAEPRNLRRDDTAESAASVPAVEVEPPVGGASSPGQQCTQPPTEQGTRDASLKYTATSISAIAALNPMTKVMLVKKRRGRPPGKKTGRYPASTSTEPVSSSDGATSGKLKSPTILQSTDPASVKRGKGRPPGKKRGRYPKPSASTSTEPVSSSEGATSGNLKSPTTLQSTDPASVKSTLVHSRSTIFEPTAVATEVNVFTQCYLDQAASVQELQPNKRKTRKPQQVLSQQSIPLGSPTFCAGDPVTSSSDATATGPGSSSSVQRGISNPDEIVSQKISGATSPKSSSSHSESTVATNAKPQVVNAKASQGISPANSTPSTRPSAVTAQQKSLLAPLPTTGRSSSAGNAAATPKPPAESDSTLSTPQVASKAVTVSEEQYVRPQRRPAPPSRQKWARYFANASRGGGNCGLLQASQRYPEVASTTESIHPTTPSTSRGGGNRGLLQASQRYPEAKGSIESSHPTTPISTGNIGLFYVSSKATPIPANLSGSGSVLQQRPRHKPNLNMVVLQSSLSVGGDTSVDEYTVSPGSLPYLMETQDNDFYEQLIAEIIPKTNKWKAIALELAIPQADIDLIEEECGGDVAASFKAVFSKWLQEGDPPFTWLTMLQVLISENVCEDFLALEMKDRYYHGLCHFM